jgi:hypothetical protein
MVRRRVRVRRAPRWSRRAPTWSRRACWSAKPPATHPHAVDDTPIVHELDALDPALAEIVVRKTLAVIARTRL